MGSRPPVRGAADGPLPNLGRGAADGPLPSLGRGAADGPLPGFGRGAADGSLPSLGPGAADGLLPGPAPEVEVVLDSPGWRAAVPALERRVRAAAGAALAELRRAGADPSGALTLLLTDDRAARRLNHDHRGRAKPTNVLSFPAGRPGRLGDVVLALGTLRREARSAGRPLAAHLAHLVVHGVLHLAGHDHLGAGEARRMERAESRAMRRLALPDPWRRTP